MIRFFLAKAVRLLFKIPFFKKRFFGFHKRIIAPFNLFKGVVQHMKFQDSIHLRLHIDDWIQENIYFVDEYEKAEFKTLKNLLNKGDVLVDIGANIGLYTLCASKLVGDDGHVICFEPFSTNFSALKTNLSINENSNIIVEKVAVGDSNSVIDLFYDDKEMNLGMVSSQLSEYSQTEKVTCVSLDSYLQNNPYKKVDFVKIDIEGNEYAALLGMKNILEKFHPILLVEILEDEELRQSGNKQKILGYLENLDYEKHFIDDNGELSFVEKNSKRCNYIFLKKNT